VTSEDHTQGLLQRAQLSVGLGRAGDLRLNQAGSFAAETMQLEHEATDVAQLHLPHPTQVSGAAADPSTLAEARLRRARFNR